YLKLRHTLVEINSIIEKSPFGGPEKKVSPELGNVCFASSLMGFVFSLESFAKIYSDYYKSFDPKEFAKRLWGDIYFDEETRKFSRKFPKEKKNPKRTFVQFILEPIYKIFSHVVGQD